MHHIVLLIAGLPGSGKSVFSDTARLLGVPVVILGDIVREEVTKRGLSISLNNILSVAQELRDTIGKDAIVMLAIDKIKEHLKHNCIVVVDGIRSYDEVSYIRSHINAEIIIVAIHSSPKTRFERLISRGRAGDPRNWKEFIDRDSKELSWGLGNVIALADIIIVNEGSIDEFKRDIIKLISGVKNRWCI